jgi:hypothetical protein
MNRESRHIFRSDADRMLDEALEATFPASDPVSAEQRVTVGRVGKPSFGMVSYGRLDKETVMDGTDAAGNRMFRSSKRKGI